MTGSTAPGNRDGHERTAGTGTAPPPDDAAVVIVGDADAFVAALTDAGLGDVQVVREEVTAPE